LHYRVSKSAVETEKRIAPAGTKFELVPIVGVRAPGIWNEARAVQLREAMRARTPLPPVRLHLKRNGEWVISDGIHRINVSVEFGYTHVPAMVSRDPKIGADRVLVYSHREPRRTVTTWFVATGDEPGAVIARRPSREKAMAFARKVAGENRLTLRNETGDVAEWS
jgi:hypothetical protein